MAGFTGAPRLWSRNYSAPQYTQYVYDNAYQKTFTGYQFGAPTLVVSHAYDRIALATASRPLSSTGTTDGGPAILQTYGWSFAITSSEYGKTTTNTLFPTTSSIGPAGGLTPITTGPAPLWALTEYTTPGSKTINRWTGAYSQDGTVFAALLRRKSDGLMTMSVSQGATTLTTRAALGIKHNNSGTYSPDAYRVETKVFVFSTTKIWIFHINETSTGAGDRGLFLSVWNGTSIASTTRLGTFQVMDFEVVRGTTGVMYLMYRPPAPTYNTCVHSVNETTGALSAALRTDTWTPADEEEIANWRSGGRMPLNKVLPAYKGLNWLVHAWADRIIVYTYATGTPGVLTLRVSGKVPWVAGSPSTYRIADTLGIEYDPVSDTAYICFLEVNLPVTGADVETRDTKVMSLHRHSMPLESLTWAMDTLPVAPVDDYVFESGSNSVFLNYRDTLGYVPSWTGAAAEGLLIVQTLEQWDNSDWPRMEIYRLANWHIPLELLGETEVQPTFVVDIAGVRDYNVPVAVAPTIATNFKAFRSRQISWTNSWGSYADISVNGTVTIDLQTSVYISGLAAPPILGAVAIAVSPTVYINPKVNSILGEADFTIDAPTTHISGAVEREFFLRTSWMSVGRTYVEDFHALANEERLTVYGLPPLPIAGTNDLSLQVLKDNDIAQIHNDNMVAIRWWAHDSDKFPPNWQLASERLETVGVAGSENILAFSGMFDEGFDHPPTALETWEAWKTSPPHYANLMTDWGATSPRLPGIVFSMLAVSLGMAHRGGYPSNSTDEAVLPDTLQEIYLTNNFVSIEETLVEVLLVTRWQKDALEAALLQHSWETKALYHVRTHLLSPYSMPLHAEHMSYYGGGITAAHAIQNTHSVVAEHIAVHSNSVGQWLSKMEASYDLQKLSAQAHHECRWSRTLSTSHVAEYEDVGRVSAGHSALYGETPRAVRAHTALYQEFAKVQRSHANLYGPFARPLAFLSAPYSEAPRATRSHAALYSEAPRPVAFFSAPYGGTPRAVQSHTALYAETPRATQSHAALYAEAPRATASLASPYENAPRATSTLSALYGEPGRTATQHAAGYALMRSVHQEHVAPAGLSAQVRTAHAGLYDFLLRNPVAAQLNAVYDLRGVGANFAALGVTASLNGRLLEVSDGYITGDYEAPGFTFECVVNDLEFVRGARLGDTLNVNFAGTPYVFFLSNVTSNSAEKSAAPTVSVSGLSPVYLLDAPYSETLSYAPSDPKMFSEIIQEVVGVPVDFSRHIDWLVPFGRAQSSSQTPLGLAKGLLDTVGSRLLSNQDGSLYVLPRYPHGLDTLPDGTPEHSLSEMDNVFTRSSSYEYAKGYNRFRIRDSDTGYGDTIEFDKDTSIASVWVSPYRTSWLLRCTTTPGIFLDALGEDVEEKDELLDFSTGTTSTAYPILDLVSVTWVTDSLGGVSFEPYSTKVTAPVATNFGYGLAHVKYRTKSSKFRLHSSAPIEATQLIIVEQ